MASASKHRKPETFVPSVTHPYTERELTLCSLAAQRHFDRLFERAQISTYQIIIMLPVFSDRQETAECEEILSGILNGSAEQLRELHELCDTKLTNIAGITSQVRYTDAWTRKVPIYTPHVGQFLGLLLSYDSLLQKLDTLWFNREFTREQRDEAMRRANVMLSDIMRELASLQERVIAARERHREAGREAVARKAAKARAKAAAAAAKRAESLDKKVARPAAPEKPAAAAAGQPAASVEVEGAAPDVAAGSDAKGVAQDAPAETREVRRVVAFVDEVGAPRVVDTVDGEFNGEHLDDPSPLDEAEAAVDAAHESLDAADAADAVSAARARKAPARKRASSTTAPLAAAAG